MKILLDTADVAQIREALRWGIIDGVTTNPTHVAKTGADPRELGADSCTMSFEVLGMPYGHPLTETGIEMFLEDWNKGPKQTPWTNRSRG